MRAVLVWLILAGLILVTPSVAQSPQSKATQIGAMIDILTAVRSAVAKSYKGQETIAYKRISIRLIECSVFFGMLAQHNTSIDPTVSATYRDASSVLALTASAVYPDSFESYKQDASKAQTELEQLHRSQDQRKQYYFLRNCNDIAQPQSVQNAVTELMLQP